MGHYARGVIYGSGNERKLVIPNCPVIYFDLDTNKVYWRQDNARTKADRTNK